MPVKPATEAAARSGAAFNTTVINSLLSQIAVLDQHGTIVAVNKAWERFVWQQSDPTHAQMRLGVDYLAAYRLAGGEETYPIVAGVEAVLAGSQSCFMAEYSHHTPTEDRWFELRVTPLDTGAGVIVAHEEISARKRMEIALRESEERFRSAFEHAAIGMALVGADGRWLQVNQVLCAITGYAEHELLATTFLAITHPSDRETDLARVRRAMAGELYTYQIEKRYIHKNGDTIWVQLTTLLMRDAHNQPLYFISQIQDITERKHFEIALIDERALLARRVEERTADLSAANAALARVARLKDEFLASMSHELRTPLNAVLGLSEALQEEVYGMLNQTQLKTLKSIEESRRHLLNLINDILDLAKIGAGKLELALELVTLSTICQVSLRLIKQDAHKKHITIETMIDPAVTLIQADARRLKQMLLNLLSNAIKFTPEGGSIGLEVVGDRAQQLVQLTVWDSGIGIAAEDIPRLFQPFVQLDSGLARQYNGTGLGLVLVYRMVEMHGGSVSVTSVVGQGSRFTISLPWNSQSPTVEPGNAALAPLAVGDRPAIRQVLIVDDEPPGRETLAALAQPDRSADE